jgi:predicted DsbA family dithiol-disulfide isomerase
VVPTLEVFADVTCPFTHVGLRRLVDARAEHGRADLRLVVRAWPLEWVNGVPFDGPTLAAKVAALRASVAPDLFAGFDPVRTPRSSLPALVLTAAASRVDAALGEPTALAVRDALFERGLDVADPPVLAAIAEELSLPEVTPADVDRVQRDYQEGRSRGVQGSPQFFTHGHGYFCPTLRIRKVGESLDIEFDAVAFAAFVADVMTEE